MKFPGIISFLENYPETISMSQNSGNFLQNGNTVHDVRMRQVMNIIHQRVNINFAPKPSFFDPAVELDAGREPNAAHRIQKRILRPLHPPARDLDLPFGQTNAPQFLCLMNIHFAPKTQFFRSHGRTRRRTRTKCCPPDTKTNSPSSAPAGSRPRSPVRPNERPPIISYLINIHFAPKTQVFFDPAVEPDAGREPNAAHRIQKRIIRPRHPPARGLDLPFVQTNAPKFSCFVPHEYSKTQFFRSRGRTRRRTPTKRGAPDTKTNSPSSAPTGSRPRSPFGQTNAPQLFRASLIFILHQKPRVFSIPRSNPTQDANQMRRTVYKNKFSVLGTRRLAASTSRSSKRTPPSFRVLCLMNIQKPSFSDPAVELDAGREPDAAHRMQKRIPRPRRRPPRGLDPPFGQANAPHFRLIKSDAQQRVWTPHVALAYYYRRVLTLKMLIGSTAHLHLCTCSTLKVYKFYAILHVMKY